MNYKSDFCHILVVEDGNLVNSYTLDKDIYTLGRDNSNDLIINDSKVSRFHAFFEKQQEANEQNSYVINDGDRHGRKSKNGLLINGKLVKKHELKHGDLIRLSSKSTVSYYIVSNASVAEFFKGTSFNTFNSETVAEHSNDLQQTLPTNHDNISVSDELLRLASFPELSSNPIIEFDLKGNITYLNSAAIIKFPELNDLGIEHEILAGLIKIHQNRRGNLLVREVQIVEEYFLEYVHYLSSKQLIRVYIFEFTEKKHLEIALRESEERYRSVVSQISESIFLVEAKSKKIIEANPAYCDLLGYSSIEILNLTLEDVVHDCENFLSNLKELLINKQHFFGEVIHRRRDGSLVDVEVGVSLIQYAEKEVFCCTVRDITSRKRTRELLQYQAFHDLLTGLPNRRLFNEQLSTALAKAKRYQHSMGVMYLDIDHFKKINDTLGHPAGDKLLESFGHRLKICLRASDTIARFGGDEFAVLLPQVNNQDDIAKLAERLIDALQQPFEIFDQEVEIKSSIGIAVYPIDGDEPETLINKADIALLRTKNKGRNNYQFYSTIITQSNAKALELENLLSQAVEDKQFFLAYQPIINSKTLQITGWEALVRWRSPNGEEILPSQFIPQALESDLIISLGDWVIKTACLQNKAWQESGLPALPVGVNISAKELQQVNFVSKLKSLLEYSNLEPYCLEIEVTEKTLNLNHSQIYNNLKNLSALGVRLCLDDFGIGSCCLGNFKDFKFDTVKIHQNFFKAMESTTSEIQHQELSVIAAIVAIGKGFKMRVVSEGIETQEQLELLKSLHCFEIQGNIYSEPLKFDEMSNFVRSKKEILL